MTKIDADTRAAVTAGGVVVAVAAVVLGLVWSSNDGAGSPPQRVEVRACPDYLEVAGPYRRGLDSAYDPAMDWDGDGVSCE